MSVGATVENLTIGTKIGNAPSTLRIAPPPPCFPPASPLPVCSCHRVRHSRRANRGGFFHTRTPPRRG
eukprot:352625-Chlamydomonas_euryale.AAC.4